MLQTGNSIKVLDKIFTVFEPMTTNPNVIPSCGGNYIFALKEGRQLPENELPCVMQRINFGDRPLEVIYTGIGRDLYDRIIKTHFGKNAGRSTLRKSLGSLMGLEKIQRDLKENGKTKFTDEGERMVTEWMCQNLLVFVAENIDFEEDEQRFIDFLNPPLNLDKNHNAVNSEYRQMLSALRSSGEPKPTRKALAAPAKTSISSTNVKTVNRTIGRSEKCRVKYNNPADFKVLRVNISYNDKVVSYEVDSKYLPVEKDSIYFTPVQMLNGEVSIIWRGDIAQFIKKV